MLVQGSTVCMKHKSYGSLDHLVVENFKDFPANAITQYCV